MMPPSQQCPACRVPLREIRLIDKGDPGFHRDLEYAAADAERRMWIGPFPIEGRISGLMCDQCGRVELYARPKDRS